ncbi:MAG TPA: hypothetical protein VLD36_20385 [Burkholderiales bacterium]|nr:hypothetical protein [Burkholderiales bacterium]
MLAPMRRDPDRTPFRCPLCGSSVYEQATVARPSGAGYLTEFFECAGCSLMFRDAERITRRERFEPGTGMTPDFRTRW